MKRVLLPVAGAFLAVLTLFACSGVSQPSGLEEPFRVTLAAYKEGELPGTPPADVVLPPSVTSLETQSTIIRARQIGKSIVGRTTKDAVAVALKLSDVGGGYWVLPVQEPDPQSDGELTWTAKCDFGATLAPGPHALRIAAIDANGHAGTQRELSLCVNPDTPDNGHTCNPDAPLSAAVFSLEWDTDVDLDLSVVLPDGRIVSGKKPRTSTEPDAGVPVGTFNRDSNGSCVVDGFRREDLTFLDKPPAGSYFAYANLFDACGQTAVHFRFSLWERQTNPDGTSLLVKTRAKEGQLGAFDANGGASLGTYLIEVGY